MWGFGARFVAAAQGRSHIRKIRSFRAFLWLPCAAVPRSAAVTPLAQQGSGAAAGGGPAPGGRRGRSLRKRPLTGACGRHPRVLPARPQVRSWRRRRALAGALRCGRVRVEGARGEQGAGFPFPSSRGARPPPRPMGALGGVTCLPPLPPERRPEP